MGCRYSSSSRSGWSAHHPPAAVPAQRTAPHTTVCRTPDRHIATAADHRIAMAPARHTVRAAGHRTATAQSLGTATARSAVRTGYPTAPASTCTAAATRRGLKGPYRSTRPPRGWLFSYGARRRRRLVRRRRAQLRRRRRCRRWRPWRCPSCERVRFSCRSPQTCTTHESEPLPESSSSAW